MKMNIFIYFCFTIFSILIQFVIMDILDINKTQAMSNQNSETVAPNTQYSNSTLQPVFYETSTKPATILDVFYDTNNLSTTETAVTTDEVNYNSSTEYYNATEFSIFPNSSTFSTAKPDTIGTKNMTNSLVCCCNLIYNICDINCCCDKDCAKEEKMLFHCIEQDMHSRSPNSCHIKTSNGTSHKSFIDHLFRAVKTNIPDKRNIVKYSQDMDTKVENSIHKFMTWKHDFKATPTFEFNVQSYVYNDPIWQIQNETLSVIDLPVPEINNYCSGRRPILYLRNLHYKCLTKVQDLEMFNIYQRLSPSSHVVSVTDKENTKVVKNCSSLHCTPWKIIVCDKLCHSYNKTLDEPSCTERICINMATKIEYIFYCNNSQIINGTLYLHKRTIPFKSRLVEQEIKVQFYLVRDNQTNIVKFSGNPGYLYGLPIIASFKDSNFTDHFFHTDFELENYIIYPANIEGNCILNNLTYKVVRFGNNIQNKCRFLQSTYSSTRNATENCQIIQKAIYDLLNVNKPIYISPLGNPIKVNDNEWIEIEYDLEKAFIYGELKDNHSKLKCYNMITKLQYVFTFAYIGKELNREILDVKALFHMQDLSIFIEDFSIIITVETVFLDVTKPPVYEYAKGPGLGIHLPEDFFLPFASNIARSNRNTIIFIVLSVCVNV